MPLNEGMDEGMETFGDLETASEGEEQGMDLDIHQDNWDIPIESPSKPANKKSTDQVENLDVEEGDVNEDGVTIKKKDKPEEELTDEELEAKETKTAAEIAAQAAKEEAEEAAPVGKIVKAKLGDKDIEFDTGLVVKQKINGKMTEVKIQDALDQYSGKIAYDKKFKDLGDKERMTTETVEKVRKYEAHMKKEIGTVEKLVADALEGKAHPMAAMKHLLDLQGKDSFVYYKKTMESLFEEFASLYDMSDSEQKAYWTAKENEHLKEKQTRISQSQQQEQENQKVLSQVEAAHKEFGVDWEGFNSALDYLVSLKDERGKPVYQEKALINNPRAVAQYAARMPYITKADALVKQFEENIDDDQVVNLTDEVSKLLHESKGANEAEILEWLETNYGVSKAVKALNQKLNKANGGASKKTADETAKWKAKTKQKLEDEIEDWDDFDLDA
jgi:hypothetical protein